MVSIENVMAVSIVNERVLYLKLVLGHTVCIVVPAYAPQLAEMIRSNICITRYRYFIYT